MKNKWRKFFTASLILGAVTVAALYNKVKIVHYEIEHELVESPVRLVYLSDLHNNQYGEHQSELKEHITKLKPDLVLLGGDIFESKGPQDPTKDLLRWLGEEYTSYYVTGNHEYYTHRVIELKQTVSQFGITVLAGQTDQLTVGETKIAISGIDDVVESHFYPQQLIDASMQLPDEPMFQLLLSHRPEHIEDYLPYEYDLILSGHAHGGQWRIPGLINGVFAPGQGYFPQYAGGRYDFDLSTLIVSRGLVYQNQPVPRIFNRPEIVVIDLIP